jgi:hypothetical protein
VESAEAVEIEENLGSDQVTEKTAARVAWWADRLANIVQSHPSADGTKTNTNASHRSGSIAARRLARILIAANDKHDVDILGHMGLEQGRWPEVVAIVKTVLQDHPPDITAPNRFDWTANVELDPSERLEDLTAKPGAGTHIRNPRAALPYRLDELTDSWNPTLAEHGRRKRCLGVIWKSLGFMILAAAERKGESATIMDHVLHILSDMHHQGVIPEAVYQFRNPNDREALSQPPTLHVLSSTILSSLSDAAWNARESSGNDEAKTLNARYFLGYEIPGSRVKVKSPKLGPEVWLELLLWSCLHGGWIAEGTRIIEAAFSTSGEHRWSLICWHRLLEAWESQDPNHVKINWSALAASFDAGKDRSSDGRAVVERKLSSEVLSAFIEALVDNIHVGVGDRGLSAHVSLGYVEKLKEILEQENLGLGATSWDAILVRFLESQGISIETNPEIALRIINLAVPFGQELGFGNIPPFEFRSQPGAIYSLDPSTAPLGILHRAIRAYVAQANIAGALKAFECMQNYIDANKRQSIHHFAERLRISNAIVEQPLPSADAGFYSPIEFPNFFPLLPSPILAELLELVTTSGVFKFGRWLLQTREIDGPLIPQAMYADPIMAPAIVRFATANRDKTLLTNVMKLQAHIAKSQRVLLPKFVLYAFLNEQICQRRWESVENTLQLIGESKDTPFDISIFAALARELIVLTGSNVIPGSRYERDGHIMKLQNLISNLSSQTYGNLDTLTQMNKNAVFAITTTVDKSLSFFCSRFYNRSGSIPLDLKVDAFNTIMEGVLEGYDSLWGKKVFDIWCIDVAAERYATKMPFGGVSRMPKERMSRAVDHGRLPEDAELEGFDLPMRFLGKIMPNLATVRLLVKKVVREEKAVVNDAKEQERRDLLGWGKRAMSNLGLDEDSIARELMLPELETDWYHNN